MLIWQDMYNFNFLGLPVVGDIINFYPAFTIATSPIIVIALRDNLMGFLVPDKVQKVNSLLFSSNDPSLIIIEFWSHHKMDNYIPYDNNHPNLCDFNSA